MHAPAVVHSLSFREALIKSGSMRLQWKMSEFKAKIARHSIAMAQIFNAEIVYFTCSIADHGLISASLTGEMAGKIADKRIVIYNQR